MRVAVVLAAACVALLADRTAHAHVAAATGTLEHRLGVRIAHDRGVIRSVDRQAVRDGSWLFLPDELWRDREWHQADLVKAAAALRRLNDRWLVSAFGCIHRYEGSWSDPNPPYYGGLQLDDGFMRSYGPALYRAKGTADHWSPAEQIAVAIRAYRSGRGFWPWPNTARYCGLL